MSVLTIQRRWRELGRLRMGDKGSKGQPQKLMSWRLTSASHTLLHAASQLYGGDVRRWEGAPDEGMYELYTDSSELDVLLPPMLDDRGDAAYAYSQYFELWGGRTCKRRCDGETELLSDKPCLCDPEDRECKVTTRASVMLPRVPSLGVWRLETHGWYAATELPGVLNLLASFADRRRLVPATLRIEQRSVTRVNDKGKPETRRFIVPVLDLPGLTLADMQGGALEDGAGPGLTASPAAVNPPAALGRAKPSLGEDAALPSDPAFATSDDPPWGDAPDVDPPDADEQDTTEPQPAELSASSVINPETNLATEAQRKALWAAVKRCYPKDEHEPALRDLIRTATGGRTESTREITAAELSGVLQHLDSLGPYERSRAAE